MHQTGLFNTILYPSDIVNGVDRTIDYVANLAHTSEADLIVLHSFRLNTPDIESTDIAEVKNMIEREVRFEFEHANAKTLEKLGIPYTLLIEVGFLPDRILSAIKNHQIDLVIFAEHLKKKIAEDAMSGYEDFLQKVDCPIMIVPKQVAPS